MNERIHFERVIGGSEDEINEAKKVLQIYFERRPEDYKKYEIEKTSEDMKIINKTTSVVDDIVREYGGDPKPLPIDNIYVFKPGDVFKMTEGELATGMHTPLGQKIIVEREESDFMFASTIAHELFHLKSPKVARLDKNTEDADVRLYRSGMVLIDRKDSNEKAGEEKEYFGAMEEAIVAECTKKFRVKIEKDESFRGELKAIETIKDWALDYYRRNNLLPDDKLKLIEEELKYIPDSQKIVEHIVEKYEKEKDRSAFAAGIFDSFIDQKKIESVERFKERRKLFSLIDEIIEKSSARFKNRDEVFDEFARANFSGKYFKIARIIESALGEGSFRKIAGDFAEIRKK
jgi:hypothetical protein